MADAGLAPYPKFKSILADGSGLPNAGGFVYFYIAGTSTPKDTQVSRTGANNANPVELDANGEADVWYLTGNYKVVETTSALVTIRTTDDVSAAGDLPAIWSQSGDDIYYDAGQVYIGATSGGEDLTVVGTASVSGTFDVTGVLTINNTDLSGPETTSLLQNATYNTIDTGTHTNILLGGNSTYGNFIGTTGLPAGTDFTPTGWAADTGYVNDSAVVASVLGGHDNISNSIAGIVVGGGHNFVKYNLAGHAIIGGGSYNVIDSGYAGIFSGRRNTITGGTGNDYSFIGGGDNNNIVGNWSVIAGGLSHTIAGDYSFVVGKANNAGGLSNLFGNNVSAAAYNGVTAFTDSVITTLTATADNQFLARFANGYILNGGDFLFNTNKLTIAASTGDTVIAGTLSPGNIIYNGSIYRPTSSSSGGISGGSATNLGANLLFHGESHATLADIGIFRASGTEVFRYGSAGVTAAGNVDAATLSTGNETFTYDEGTFTATYTGFTTTVAPTMSYARVGSMVTIYTNAATGTSNTTGMTCSGMPASIRPPAQGAQCFIAAVTDNGTETANCKVAIDSSGVMTFYLLSGSNWTTNFTNSGTKGHQPTAISYNLVSVI